MWKGLLVGCVSVPFALVSFLLALVTWNAKVGFAVGLSMLLASWVVAVVMVLTTRRFSIFDVFLPIPVAVAWSFILTIFSLGGNAFAAPACIGSALLLSACLWMIQRGRFPVYWAILPIITFMYEMLPVNVPGPFDDWFAFGGDGAFLVLQGIVYSLRQGGDSLDQLES
jgi:hypothetical protein